MLALRLSLWRVVCWKFFFLKTCCTSGGTGSCAHQVLPRRYSLSPMAYPYFTTIFYDNYLLCTLFILIFRICQRVTSAPPFSQKPFTHYINTDFLCWGAPEVHTSAVRLHTSITHTFLAIERECPYFLEPGGRKRLSLIQMVLLGHLKAGFKKRGSSTR